MDNDNNNDEAYLKPMIKDLREWGCNTLADILAAELSATESVAKEEGTKREMKTILIAAAIAVF